MQLTYLRVSSNMSIAECMSARNFKKSINQYFLKHIIFDVFFILHSFLPDTSPVKKVFDSEENQKLGLLIELLHCNELSVDWLVYLFRVYVLNSVVDVLD